MGAAAQHGSLSLLLVPRPLSDALWITRQRERGCRAGRYSGSPTDFHGFSARVSGPVTPAFDAFAPSLGTYRAPSFQVPRPNYATACPAVRMAYMLLCIGQRLCHLCLARPCNWLDEDRAVADAAWRSRGARCSGLLPAPMQAMGRSHGPVPLCVRCRSLPAVPHCAPLTVAALFSNPLFQVDILALSS